MKIAVTGASGLIGSALLPALRAQGHEVATLVRRAPTAPGEVRWDPATGPSGADELARELAGVGAGIHLAGAGVGDHRWTEAYKRTIHDSRVQGTATFAAALARLDPAPAVLVSASAIGWYGDTGDRAVDESAPAANDFLAQVVVDWEAAAEPARTAGIRVVHPRTGIVLTAKGGALARLLPIFRLGAGGKIGSGRQFWSWITLADEVRALLFLLEQDALSGPVNLTGPAPARNSEITRALAGALHRPSFLPVPKAALRVALGEFSQDILGSQRVLPTALLDAGFAFEHPDLDSAVQAVLAER